MMWAGKPSHTPEKLLRTVDNLSIIKFVLSSSIMFIKHTFCVLHRASVSAQCVILSASGVGKSR